MKRVMNSIAALLFLAVAVQAELIQPADRFKLVNISDPQFSPDNRSIVCVVSRTNVNDELVLRARPD